MSILSLVVKLAIATVAVLVVTACCHAQNQPATKRSQQARQAFMQTNPCPATGKSKGACPGYVVDHIVPIKRGGGDNQYNMQWQTVQDAKEKDKWE